MESARLPYNVDVVWCDMPTLQYKLNIIRLHGFELPFPHVLMESCSVLMHNTTHDTIRLLGGKASLPTCGDK